MKEGSRVKVGERGQITIPKRLRERYGLRKDTDVELVPEDGGIRIQKQTRGQHPVQRLRGILKLKHGESVDEYIEEIRGR
jgi:AbrB family looped-hinge helix DNA binding protein